MGGLTWAREPGLGFTPEAPPALGSCLITVLPRRVGLREWDRQGSARPPGRAGEPG